MSGCGERVLRVGNVGLEGLGQESLMGSAGEAEKYRWRRWGLQDNDV